MDQKNQDSSQTPREDLVKKIFDRPKAEKQRVSSIFTHFRHSPKVVSPGPRKDAATSHLRPLPVAIDIGTTSIKLVRLGEAKDGRIEIISIDEEDLASGGELITIGSLKASLKSIVGRNRVGHSCVTAISSKSIHFYNMMFPQMPDSELMAAVRFKVGQLKPFELDIDNLVVRFSKWSNAEENSKGGPRKIIVACVPKYIVDERIALLQELGLTVIKVGLDPFELINLSSFYKSGGMKDEISLWADMGADNAFLVIEKDSSLCFSRNLTLTSNHMTASLAKYAGVDEKEAEKLKKNYGLIFWSPDKKIPAFYEPAKSPEEAEDKSERVYYGLISHAENLVVDMMHSFKYFSYQVAQSRITRFHRVILCGGGVNLKNMDQFLSVRLGVPVERINPFGLFKMADGAQGRRKDLMAASANFAVCIGLAAGQKLDQSNQINLVSKEEKEPVRIFQNILKIAPAAAAVALVAAAAFLTASQMQKTDSIKSQVTALQAKVGKAKSKLGDVQARQIDMSKEEAELLSNKELLGARLSLVQGGLRTPKNFSKLLTSLADALPEDVWITKLKYKGGKLTISGSAIKMDLVSDFIEDMKTADGFRDASLSFTEKDADFEIFNFEIIADIKV
ncbi:MAG: pilus assembly protein PilM [Candidatus Omnitrophica bacterium]|nr:pilus assembly protein PilM [Candidatus Omnitrophota bacterium]